MKKFLLILLLGCCFTVSYGKHITGGEVIYDYIGPGSNNSTIYKITLRLFRDENCFGCAEMPVNVTLGIFNNSTFGQYGPYILISLTSTEILPINTLPSCLTNMPVLNYRVGYYTKNIEVPNNTAGYTVTYQTCCRIDFISN